MKNNLAHCLKIGHLSAKLLRLLPPETAHDLAMTAMAKGLLKFLPRPYSGPMSSSFRVRVPGVGELAHPLGLAAGFDKQALCPKAFVELGCSFLEIGTVTPLPQPGHPRPRLFRQSSQRGIINRMGFNSHGSSIVAKRLEALQWEHERIPLGVNLGKNKNTTDERAIDDFLSGIQMFSKLGKYLVVNISSPNTPGLRGLANRDFIDLLADQCGAKLPQIWLKLDPDMPKASFQKLVEKISERGFQGIILTNTHRVEKPEMGGQSGHPLAVQSTTCLEWAYEVHGGRLPMIGSGGVLSGTDVFQKLARGASAVQLYAAFIYRGPWAVVELLDELAAEMQLRQMATMEDVIGSHYRGG